MVPAEGQSPLIRGNSHEQIFKSVISSDIGKQMVNVSIPFTQQLRVCFCEVCQCNRLSFGDVEFRRQDLRGAVDKKRLSSSLFVECLNDLWCEGLSDFLGILCKEFTDLFEREVWHDELILDIEG